MFGILPSYPATGYGYIKSKNKLKNKAFTANKVQGFIEKPNLNKAKLLCEDKNYTWNSGMFMFKASNIIGEFTKYEPKILESCHKSLEFAEADLDFLRLNENYFS